MVNNSEIKNRVMIMNFVSEFLDNSEMMIKDNNSFAILAYFAQIKMK